MANVAVLIDADNVSPAWIEDVLEEAGKLGVLALKRVQTRVGFEFIDAKRRATRYLHARPLLADPVDEVSARLVAGGGHGRLRGRGHLRGVQLVLLWEWWWVDQRRRGTMRLRRGALSPWRKSSRLPPVMVPMTGRPQLIASSGVRAKGSSHSEVKSSASCARYTSGI